MHECKENDGYVHIVHSTITTLENNESAVMYGMGRDIARTSDGQRGLLEDTPLLSSFG